MRVIIDNNLKKNINDPISMWKIDRKEVESYYGIDLHDLTKNIDNVKANWKEIQSILRYGKITRTDVFIFRKHLDVHKFTSSEQVKSNRDISLFFIMVPIFVFNQIKTHKNILIEKVKDIDHYHILEKGFKNRSLSELQKELSKKHPIEISQRADYYLKYTSFYLGTTSKNESLYHLINERSTKHTQKETREMIKLLEKEFVKLDVI